MPHAYCLIYSYTELLQPPPHVNRGRAAFRTSPADSGIGSQISINVLFDLRREALQLAERQVFYFDAALDAGAHDASDDAMCRPKRHTVLNEVIGEIGRIHEPVGGGLRHALLSDFDAGRELAHDFETRLDGIDGVEERPFVFLQIAI